MANPNSVKRELKFARFGHHGPDEWSPKGGACISSFVVVVRNESILLGKVGDEKTWTERWSLPIWKPEPWRGKWVIPGSHLLYGEHPTEAAHRVMREQLNIQEYELNFVNLLSYESGRHWDLCFMYKGSVEDEIATPPWFSNLEFLRLKEVKLEELGRNHGDLLDYRTLIKEPILRSSTQ